MADDRTTIVVQSYLNQLAEARDTPAKPIVRKLLAESVGRLHLLCTSLLIRSYPRLTHPPMNLEPDEVLSAVVERMIKAMRSVRPEGVRQFFALANQHIRWELNDLARRLDKEASARLILEEIEGLPEEEREVFELVRIQGMTQPDAAEILEVSAKTVQRRLNRALMRLSEKLFDLQPPLPPPSKSV